MTTTEIQILKQALNLLHRLIPDDEPRAIDLTPRRCPVQAFAKQYLARNPASDMSCIELWQFYAEVAAAGEAERLSRAEFLRALPGAMAAVFGICKSHSICRDGKNVRGFRCVGIKCSDEPFTVGELAIEPDFLPEPNLDPEPMTGPPPVTEIWSSAPRVYE